MTSTDHTSSNKAIEKADEYIHQSSITRNKSSKTSQDRTLINKAESQNRDCSRDEGVSTSEASQAAFLQSLEEDSKERGERRRQREERGKEAKKKGNKAFKEGKFEGAVEFFTEAIKEMPWDLTLYTNRALVRSHDIIIPTACMHFFGI